ncbi:MAG: hypothetical protein VX951_04895 [Planctomycetota bacterium]|nr:hypothetical protein [Planctomycetota bacterium]
MTGDDVFHPDDDDLNLDGESHLDDEFVLQDWQDEPGTAEAADGCGMNQDDLDTSALEHRTSVESMAEEGAEFDRAPWIAASQEILAGFGSDQVVDDVPPPAPGHEFELGSAFRDIVQSSASDLAEQDAGSFDLLSGDEDELILIEDKDFEQVPEAEVNAEWSDIDDSRATSGSESAPNVEMVECGSEYEANAAGYEESDHPNSAAVIRHGGWRRIAAIAAALVILSLSSVYFRKPAESEFSVLPPDVDVITVQRPAAPVKIEAPPPAVQNDSGDPEVATTGSAPAKPMDTEAADLHTAGVEPAGTVVLKTDPPAVGRTAGSVAEPGSTAAELDSTQGDVATLEPPAVGASDSPVQIGGETRTVLDGLQDKAIMERHRKTLVHKENGLVMGSRAWVQLLNNSIFVGTVKTLDSSFVTLRIKSGEITLARESIRSLTNVNSGAAEHSAKNMKAGSLRLRNSNWLEGEIVETGNESVIVQLNSNRIVVPLSDVEEVIEGRAKNSVQMADSMRVERDQWFRKLVEDQMQNKTKASHPVTESVSASPRK